MKTLSRLCFTALLSVVVLAGCGGGNSNPTVTAPVINKIATGAFHTIALKTDGTLWAWGYNFDGQLGDTTTVDKHTPTRIGTGTTWSAINAGRDHTIALKTDGTLWAWGWNGYGQLGDGTLVDKSTPTQIVF